MAADFLSLLERSCKSVEAIFAAGETVFRQGESVRWLYLVAKGRIRLSRVLAGGGEVAVARVGHGEILAEASVFSPRYHCDAIAETHITLRRYAVRDVRALLNRASDAASAYGAHLASELMSLRATVEVRAIRRADDRLLAWMHLRARGTPPVFEGQGSWPAVARQIGLTSESLYRALARLEGTRKIRREGRKAVLRSG